MSPFFIYTQGRPHIILSSTSFYQKISSDKIVAKIYNFSVYYSTFILLFNPYLIFLVCAMELGLYFPDHGNFQSSLPNHASSPDHGQFSIIIAQSCVVARSWQFPIIIAQGLHPGLGCVAPSVLGRDGVYSSSLYFSTTSFFFFLQSTYNPLDFK
jgi:hypothetical protein